MQKLQGSQLASSHFVIKSLIKSSDPATEGEPAASKSDTFASKLKNSSQWTLVEARKKKKIQKIQ